jgi:hypothetical protein
VSDLHPEGLPVVVWSSPTLVLFGFVALVGLVIVLGRSSTARYEVGRYSFDRNSAESRREEPAAIGAASAGSHGSAGVAAPEAPSEAVPEAPSGGHSAMGGESPRPVPAAVGAHPAGRSRAISRPAAWWLVDDEAVRADDSVVAGPFDDRIDAEWRAVATGLAASVRPEYGVLGADGALVSRESAADRAWLVELGLQLARLPEDWDAFLSETDDLGTLVVEVGAALIEAGLPLYDCAAFGPEEGEPAGGVCLVPDPGSGGIVVSWRSHDRMAVQQVRGTAVGAAVQQAMTAVLGEVLARLGFEVRPLSSGAGHLVTLDRF